ncbi:5'-3' exonuclease, C-terminal domain-containing protein [Artemisia annua]|uniref:5'-3' exonuclease, C-terminal domain-containing protein n=1 Tax=Artemisia annua TaxID=35608 RepID=A0A2U1K9H5_ARTAN|nr:5'-3' exonuclease, C-terminal domain-containing protein [Artemisia annua]
MRVMWWSVLGSLAQDRVECDEVKHIVSQGVDIESELGLTREKLIRMAMLLGSDYPEGINGIGIVNAAEVLNAFPQEDGLQKFREDRMDFIL